MPQLVYDIKGYPQLVYTVQDLAERKARKQPSIKQLANPLIRSIFEDGGLGRVLSIDEVTPGTPANGWTIRFTGETNGRTADPYIATYDGQAISYNDDPSRQSRDLSEGLALALEFAAKKDGQKNCTKGKPCGGSCIAKGRNCRREKQDLSPNQQKAADAIADAKPAQEKSDSKTKNSKESASLEASDWNPDAIPDLTAKEFREYLTRKQLIAGQENPEGAWNQTRRQSGLSVARYKLAISDAIAAGYVPTDAAIADANLNKKQLKLVEENKALLAETKRQVESIDRAINAPMRDEKSKEWKSRMTEAEAADYAEGSFFGNTRWYHGNRAGVTESIAGEGALPERNDRGMYGQGVYFGVDRRTGESYAASTARSGTLEETPVSIITTHVRVKNPYIADHESMTKLGKNFIGDQDNGVDSVAISQFLKAKGYDSIYLQDLGYVVAFDRNQVVTIQQQSVTSEQVKSFKINTSRSEEQEWVRTNQNGSKFGKLSRTESDIDYEAQWSEDDDTIF